MKQIIKLQKSYSIGLLLKALEEERILIKIRVNTNGNFTIDTQSWEEYWFPLYNLNNARIENGLDKLHSAWQTYIRSSFSLSNRKDYCFHYFSLLDDFMLNTPKSDCCSFLLKIILGFECFGITSSNNDVNILGAGICSKRNPCYLLAKLKVTGKLDNPEYFPLIITPDPEEINLFYHYRQYSLTDSNAILLYPSVSLDKRSDSFKIINLLAKGLNNNLDPRVLERTRRLSKIIISELLQVSRFNNHDCSTLEILDVGAGSGGLIANICGKIHEKDPNLKIRLILIDLYSDDILRFFRNTRIKALDSTIFYSDDYRGWLNRNTPLPNITRNRIALVSKLFNNLSYFTIQHFPKGYFCTKTNISGYVNIRTCRPSVCLAPSGNGTKSIAMSNSRIFFRNGRTFSHFSLSDYYRGIYSLIHNIETSAYYDDLFLPVRKFNPDCLVTKDGKSIIQLLAGGSSYLIIEDADLSKSELMDHLKIFNLFSLSVTDMTRSFGLKGNYIYLISMKNGTGTVNLPGEQIW